MQESDSTIQFQVQTENLARAIHWTNIADTKGSIITAFNITLLSILFSIIPDEYTFNCTSSSAIALCVVCLGISLFYVFLTLRPNISGSNNSVFFFADIAKMPLLDFKNKSDASLEDQLMDILEQVHNVSVIANTKYKHLNKAFQFLYIGILAWFITIYLVKLFG